MVSLDDNFFALIGIFFLLFPVSLAILVLSALLAFFAETAVCLKILHD